MKDQKKINVVYVHSHDTGRYVQPYGVAVPIMAQIDDSPSKEVLAENGYSEQRLPDEELYDVRLDPVEACSLVDSPEHSERLGRMRDLMDTWMERTDDPVPPSDSAQLGEPTDYPHRDSWKRIKKPE